MGRKKGKRSAASDNAEKGDEMHRDKRGKTTTNAEDDSAEISAACSSAPMVGKPYSQQINEKRKWIVNLLKKTTKSLSKTFKQQKLDLPRWLKYVSRGVICAFDGVEPSPKTEGYRNKCDFTIGVDKEGDRVVGFVSGDWTSPTESAQGSVVASPTAQAVAATVQELVRASEFPVFNKQTNQGFWKVVTVRETVAKEGVVDVMVVMHVSAKEVPSGQVEKARADFVAKLKAVKNPGIMIKSLYWHEDEKPYEKVDGDDALLEHFCELNFEVSPAAFFQVNSGMATILVNELRQWVDIGEKSVVVDVCCGTGTIGMTFCKKVWKVFGIELNEKAVGDAKANAVLNNCSNYQAIAGKAEVELPKLLDELTSQNDDIRVTVVVDPPRCGLQAGALKALQECDKVETIVYVSCNPQTLSSDIQSLCSKAEYRTIKAKAFDMFPHTEHCEVMVLLKRWNDKEQEAGSLGNHCWNCGSTNHSRSDCPDRNAPSKEEPAKQ